MQKNIVQRGRLTKMVVATWRSLSSSQPSSICIDINIFLEGVEIETDMENAASLAKALYIAIAIPMTICCFIYSFLYCTYPRDRARARMRMEKKMKYILVTGGVVSGLGKGVTASSIGVLLKA
ncbi:hypothetical protein IFM89_021679 [Coptis chinensis]|uniref:CTP synthase N-terminal domain-containing protein n=1 Tax=Coptis chinensis TaxID=261450 RepID=A0A835IEI8_9MAGN|nr:hypothetical protein IFM89_021679 [Coptis chinensis]